jgi:uncharacterized membrane protein
MSSNDKQCLKCGYVRGVGDEAAPIESCPKCGAIYAKVEAALREREAAGIKPAVSAPPSVRPRSVALPSKGDDAEAAHDDPNIVQVDIGELKASPIAHLIYAVLLLSPLVKISWIAALAPIAGIVVAYIMRSPDKDTWLDSHFTWQIRTFWIGFIVGAVLLLIGFAFGYLVLRSIAGNGGAGAWIGYYGGVGTVALMIAVSLWLLFRTIKGWYRLFKREPMW